MQQGDEMKRLFMSETNLYINKYGESVCLLENYKMSWLSTARQKEV